MKRAFAFVLLGSLLSAFAPHTRADDAADATKVAHDFMVDLVQLDFDKVTALGRPQDSASGFPGPPDDFQRQVRELENLAPVQDLRKQLAAEAEKAISLSAPALAPDNSVAIVTATPLAAEAQKFCELMELYRIYIETARQNKAQGIPPPKVDDLRTRIMTPGSPEQAEIAQQVASFPTQKLRLQLEKTPVGWRVNLHAFQAGVSGSP